MNSSGGHNLTQSTFADSVFPNTSISPFPPAKLRLYAKLCQACVLGYPLLGSVGSPETPLADEAHDEDKGKAMEGFIRQGKDSGTHSNCDSQGSQRI